MKPASRAAQGGISILLLCLLFLQGGFGTVLGETECTQKLTISPSSVFQAQLTGWQTSQTLTLSNQGVSKLDFRIGSYHPPSSVLMLNFEENKGSQVFVDSSGNGNNGYCVGSSCPTAGVNGKFGRAVEFDGEDDFIQTSMNGFPTGNGDRTMAGWVKLNAYVNEWKSAFLMGYGNFGERDQLYSLEMAGSLLYFSNWGHILVGPSLQLHRWYHVAVTNKGNLVTLYVDGKQVAANTLTLNTQVGTPFTLGYGMAELYGGGRLEGLLDEVVMIDRALSSAEINSLYQFFGDVQVPWLKVSPLTGTINSGASFPVQLQFDSRQLAPGRYSTSLLIRSDNPSDAMITVPVELLVWNSVFIPIVGP